MSDLPTARDVLAPEHPLCRILDQMDTLAEQIMLCVALLVGTAAGAYPTFTHAGAVAIADCAVVALLVAIRLVLGGERYRRARKVLIQRGRADIIELRAVQRRLAEHARRERLAQGLTDALESALAWHTIPAARRPPPSVRRLEARAGAVREIVAALGKADADVRAVAMVEELLDGGYAAALYRLDCRALGDELERIRFTLNAASSKSTPV
jgi:hypothetical protein